jgi:hypothetical protein
LDALKDQAERFSVSPLGLRAEPEDAQFLVTTIAALGKAIRYSAMVLSWELTAVMKRVCGLTP